MHCLVISYLSFTFALLFPCIVHLSSLSSGVCVCVSCVSHHIYYIKQIQFHSRFSYVRTIHKCHPWATVQDTQDCVLGEQSKCYALVYAPDFFATDPTFVKNLRNETCLPPSVWRRYATMRSNSGIKVMPWLHTYGKPVKAERKWTNVYAPVQMCLAKFYAIAAVNNIL